MIALLLLAVAPTTQVEAGPLTIRVHASPTAQLFHVVDQLSGWSPYAHEQYRALVLADAGVADEALLAEHAALRRRTGWGGLEPYFYTDGTVAQALAAMANDAKLTPHDVETERRVLAAFEPRLKRFFEQRAKSVDGFAQRLAAQKGALADFAQRAARFLGAPPTRVEVFAIPSPGTGTGGGGFNGGVLTVELVEGQAPLDVLLHECWHALAEPKRQLLVAAARAADLDYETLSESLAYAVAPGLYRHSGERGDALSARAKRELDKSFVDDPFVRFFRSGTAVRPSLAEALDSSTLEAYLPTAVAIHRGLAALYDGRTERAFFVFPRAAKPLAQKLAEQSCDAWARNFDEVDSVKAKVRPQDVVVLLLTPGAVPPPALLELLGPEWDPKKLPRAGTLTLTSGRARAVLVVDATLEAALARAVKLDL